MSVIYWLLGLDSPQTITRTAEWTWYSSAPVPVALLVLVALLALLSAGLNFLPQNVMPWRTRLALAGVRIVGFGIIALMITQLELRLRVDRSLSPNVAVLLDTSGSMGVRDVDGKARLDAARGLLEGPLDDLAPGVKLARYSCAWRLNAGHDASEPHGMTRLFRAIGDLAARENDLQAIVVLTDGNDTGGDRGKLLAPLLARRGIPVYPIVLGDPNAPRLAKVTLLGTAPYCRLGDEFPVTATLSATGLEEQAVRVSLFQDGRKDSIAARENVRIGKDPVDVRFVVKPEQTGRIVYRIVMDGVPSLATEKTLVAECPVEVLNARIKVLYLDIPRDERKMLGHWLARDPVIDLAMLTMMPKGGWYAQGEMKHENAGDGIPNRESDLYLYDVILLGDIPRSYFREGGDIAETKMQWLGEFTGRRGGGLMTLGGRSVYAAGHYQDSPLARILPVTIESTDKPQVMKTFRVDPTPLGLTHPVMQLEHDPEANREAWLDLPSLDGCNRVGRAKPGATVLAVRHVEDQPMPILAVQNVGKGKVLSLAVDTTWRWEMMRSAESEDHFRRFWGNAIRYLAPDPRIEPNKPQVLLCQSQTPVGQTVTLATRLVDGVFRPVRGADLVVQVTSPSGKLTSLYPRDGQDTPGLYQYSVELHEPGEWKVATTYRGQVAEQTILAGAGAEEFDDPRARPDVLSEFASATGGRSFTPAEVHILLKKLHLSERSVTRTVTVAVWNLPALLVLLIGLVSIDCLVRKRRGMV